MKRIRFHLLVVQDYWPGAAALIQSVADKSGLDPSGYEWRIYSDQAEPASRWVRERPERIEIRPVAELGHFPTTGRFRTERFRECFRKIGLWNLPHEPGIRYVYLDCDLLCVGSLEGLEAIEPFAAAPDSLAWTDRDAAGRDINGGFWIFEPDPAIWPRFVAQYCNSPERYNSLAEQDLLNQSGFLEGATRLTSDWNFQTRFTRAHGKAAWKRPSRPIRFLHFMGAKPWWPIEDLRNASDSGYWFLEKHWWRAYRASGFNQYLAQPLTSRDCWAKSHLSPWTPRAVIRDVLRRRLR